MQRYVGFWDVGEMQTVPYILGIAHPTGFPAFTLSAWAFTHLVPFGTVAWRTTLFCALAMSATAWVIYRLVREETGNALAGLFSAWLFAFTDLAWGLGTRTDVHALSMLLLTLTLFLVLRWTRSLRPRDLLAAAVLWGLAIATHPIAALAGVGLFVIVLSRWDVVGGRVLALSIVSCLTITVALYAYLPLRSAQVYRERRDPTLSLGLPPGKPFWDYDHPSTRAGFVQLVSGSDFTVGDGLAAIFLPRTYLRHGGRYVAALADNFTPAGALLAFAAAVFFVLRERPRAIGFLVAGLIPVPFALGYPPEADVSRYFLPSFGVAAALAGIGAAAFFRGRSRYVTLGVLAGLLIVALEISAHRARFEQRFDPGAVTYIDYVIAHTQPNAIILAPWIYATPLAYAAYVEQRTADRIIETAWLSDDVARVPAWIARRPIYVVYLPWGDLPPGFQLVNLGGYPPLYRLVPARR